MKIMVAFIDGYILSPSMLSLVFNRATIIIRDRIGSLLKPGDYPLTHIAESSLNWNGFEAKELNPLGLSSDFFFFVYYDAV